MEPDAKKSTINFDRALPALPLKLCLDLPPNISFKPPTRTENPHERLGSSTNSPTSPTSRGRQHFRSITRDLLRSSDPPMPSPISTSGQPGLLDPVKQNLSDNDTQNPNILSGSQSYHDAPKATPFVDQHYAHFGNYFQDHVKSQPSTGDSMEANSNTRFQVPKGMSQSRSESHLNYDAMPTRIRSPIHHEARETRNHYERREARNRHVNFSDDLGHSPVSPSTRGRLPSRAPSPIKLDDIKEDQPTDVPLSPIKRSRSPVKQLFGEHGWLGRSTSMKELPSDEYRKTGLKHWGGKLKQRVGEIVSHPPSEFSTKPTDRTLGNQTEDMSKKLHSSSPPSYHPNDTALSTSPSRLPPATKFPVSLSPPEQAKLFAEVELMICSTANQYLQTQHQYGRLAPTSVSKVAQTWTAKNRPQVLEFMYDQQTQHDLVLYNLKTFRFYGPQAENSIALNAMMLAWKQLGRDLSVRTFCTPDSAVRKQLHDAYKVLEMLGAPLVTFLAFQSLQFETVKLIQERQLARDRHQLIRYGVERRWEPSKTEIVDEEMNPFK